MQPLILFKKFKDMRKKILFIVAVISIFAGTLKSQDPYKFVPIKFLDYTPKWFFYVEDSTAIGESSVDHYDYISQFVPLNSIVRDNFLYSLYKTRLKCSVDGVYVEKRDVNTGKKVWSYLHDLRTGGNNEKPSRMIINSSGDLEILEYRSIERKVNQRFPSFYSKLAIRILDTESGELIDSSFASLEDTSAILIHRDYPLFELNYTDSPDSSVYQYIKYSSKEPWYNNNVVTAYTLDQNGYKVDQKEAVFDSILPIPRISLPTLLEDNTFISTRHVYNDYSRYDEKYEYRYFIDKYDRDMNILNSADITEVLNAKNDYRLNLKYVDNDMIIFRYINEPELWNWKIYYYIFDHYGNLLDSVNTYPDDTDDFYAGTIQRISQDEFLIVGMNLNAVDRDFTQYFYKKKIGQPLRLVKKVKMGPYFYFAAVYSIYMLDNGDFLMQGKTGPKINGIGGNAWPFWMYIPAKDLEGGTGVDDEHKSELSLTLYPNPSSEKISINFDDVFSGELEIVDITGRSIMNKRLIGIKEVEVNISDIPQGFYFVKTKSADARYKIVSFMKE